MPSLAELSPPDQLATFASGASPDLGGVGERLAGTLQVIRAGLPEVRAAIQSGVAEYVQFVAVKLGEAGYPLSTRRAVQLARNIEALAAVLATEGGKPGTEDAFFVALRHSIPDAAWGRPVPRTQLAAIHRTAWEIVRAEFDELKSLLREADPLRRIARVLSMGDVPAVERGQVLADSYAALERPSRLLAAAVLMPRVARCGDLPAASIEAIAADYEQLAGGWPLAVNIDAPWQVELLNRWDPALRRKKARESGPRQRGRTPGEGTPAAKEPDGQGRRPGRGRRAHVFGAVVCRSEAGAPEVAEAPDERSPLMHGISVRPSRQVLRLPLPGRRVFLDCRWLTDARVALLQTHGPIAALALLDADDQAEAALAIPPITFEEAEQTLAERFTRSLADEGLPDTIGVFLKFDGPPPETTLSRSATLAVLARRSGPLYLPRRPFSPSLVERWSSYLVFPEESHD